MPDDVPLVVYGKEKGGLVIVAADRAALRLGLGRGLALSDARARVPSLAAAETTPRADAALLAAIADWCDRYTPLVALDPPDGLMLDITGCAHLFGGEQSLYDDLLRRLAAARVTARAALADAPFSARALARCGQGGILAPGEQAGLHGLPVAALDPDPDLAMALARTGLRGIGDLASRQRAPLAARFGADFVTRLDRVLGRIEAPISPRRIVPLCEARRAWNDPLVDMGDVQRATVLLANDLCRLLEERGEGGLRYEIAFFRVDGAVRRVEVATARATRDAGLLARLIAERLEALPAPLDAGFGFDLIRLAALLTAPQLPSQSALTAEAEGDHRLAGLLDTLSARLGPERVVRFVPRDTHIPERAAQAVPVLHNVGNAVVLDWPRPSPGEPPSRPLSLFEPPQPVDVVAEVPDGPPVRFRWRRVLHRVVKAEGPERIAAEWWQPGPAGSAPTRDYYRIEDSDGRRFWLFREGLYGRETDAARWYLHGLLV